MYCNDCGRDYQTTVCPYHSQVSYPPQGLEVKPYLCPKCNGQKKVQTPPWVAGDQPEYTAGDFKLYDCPVCNAQGVIWK